MGGRDRTGEREPAQQVRGSNSGASATNPRAPHAATAARESPSAPANEPASYFASAARAAAPELERAIQRVTQSPVTTALLRSATSMMCVLNEHRQIVTLNTAYLDSLDMAHSDDVIGLRTG